MRVSRTVVAVPVSLKGLAPHLPVNERKICNSHLEKETVQIPEDRVNSIRAPPLEAKREAKRREPTVISSTMELPRDLNSYESMLATFTCNVGIRLTVPRTSNDTDHDFETKIREAWSRTVRDRKLLQVRLVTKEGEMGPLGQLYGLSPVKETDTSSLFVIERGWEETTLVRKLQKVRTTAVDITKGSYYVVCSIKNDNDKQWR